MPSPNAVFTELVSTTIRKHKKDIKDNVSNRNALYKAIYSKGNYDLEDGGLSIAIPLDYAENGTYQRFSDWDVLNIGASDVISSAEYTWKQIALNVVASGREMRINSGSSKLVSLAKAKMKNAIRTFTNNFSSDMYSAGTATNQINGLQALVNDTGVGTVGGIDSSATIGAFWRNEFFDLSTEGVTMSATTIENSVLLPAWLRVDRGPDDCPDLIVFDNNYYSFFESSQASLKRYSTSKNMAAGMQNLMYKTAEVLYDGNSGIPANRGYMLNTQYIKLCVHKDADLEVMDEARPINQDGSVTQILWMGNATCSNRSQQQVILP